MKIFILFAVLHVAIANLDEGHDDDNAPTRKHYKLLTPNYKYNYWNKFSDSDSKPHYYNVQPKYSTQHYQSQLPYSIMIFRHVIPYIPCCKCKCKSEQPNDDTTENDMSDTATDESSTTDMGMATDTTDPVTTEETTPDETTCDTESSMDDQTEMTDIETENPMDDQTEMTDMETENPMDESTEDMSDITMNDQDTDTDSNVTPCSDEQDKDDANMDMDDREETVKPTNKNRRSPSKIAEPINTRRSVNDQRPIGILDRINAVASDLSDSEEIVQDRSSEQDNFDLKDNLEDQSGYNLVRSGFFDRVMDKLKDFMKMIVANDPQTPEGAEVVKSNTKSIMNAVKILSKLGVPEVVIRKMVNQSFDKAVSDVVDESIKEYKENIVGEIKQNLRGGLFRDDILT